MMYTHSTQTQERTALTCSSGHDVHTLHTDTREDSADLSIRARWVLTARCRSRSSSRKPSRLKAKASSHGWCCSRHFSSEDALLPSR